MRLFADANYDFLSRRRIAYVVSAAVIGLFVAGALFWQVRAGSWANYGVDFTGGTLVQIEFFEPTDVSLTDLRSTISEVLPDAEVTGFGGANEFLVHTAFFEEGEEGLQPVVNGALAQAYGEDTFQIVRTEAVGAKVGGELQRRAVIAIALSFLLTLIYLAFRFEWRFGVAAIIAALHDIAITLGLIAFFRLDVSLPTVAAVLTIIGYSLNDTIVVFDRIRENLKKFGRRDTYENLLNRSINDVLPRTIMTSATTLVALLALFFVGGAIIRDFTLILIIGIVVGTYSSIFVASPALLEIEKRWREGKGRGKSAKKGSSASRASGRARRATRVEGTPAI